MNTQIAPIDLSLLSLRNIAAQSYATAAEHGFHEEDEVNIDQKLLLAIGELIEAQNELRVGRHPKEVYIDGRQNWQEEVDGQLGKYEGFGIELADALIRILDLAHSLNVDIQQMVELKMNYNEGRPFKHGKQF